jgi:esterase/lipase superfamily enzyme
MLPVWRAIGVLVCALSLSGCLTPPDFDTGGGVHSQFQRAAQSKNIWFVTTRCDAPMTGSAPGSTAELLSKRCWDVAPPSGEIPDLHLGLANGPTVHCGPATVNVAGTEPTGPSAITAFASAECDAPFEALRQAINGTACKCALIFVHGFNTTLPYALKRTGQLALDLNYPGVTVLFSFGASGRFHDYANDVEAAELAAPALHRLLVALSQGTGFKVDVVAHSMGTRLALRAVTEGEAPSVHHMIAAAPDVDPAAFLQLANKALSSGGVKHLTVYTAEYDTAMAGSVYQHNGRNRVGEGLTAVVGKSMPNADVINASNTATTGYGHSYFAESTLVLTDIRAALNDVKIEQRQIDPDGAKGPTIPCPANESCSPSLYEQAVKWITRLAF